MTANNAEKKVEILSGRQHSKSFRAVFPIYKEAQSLIDGAYDIIELWKAESPAQIEWKKRWLENARKHGASGE